MPGYEDAWQKPLVQQIILEILNSCPVVLWRMKGGAGDPGGQIAMAFWRDEQGSLIRSEPGPGINPGDEAERFLRAQKLVR